MLTRRTFVASTSIMATAAMVSIPSVVSALAGGVRDIRLTAAPGTLQIALKLNGITPVWNYNGQTPGPEIRVRQGERLRITIENKLEEETTVHWHGIRTPNSMDGVPHLTQEPIASGKNFIYDFDAVDAGTFWYHPHQRGFEQVARGLYGPLIIEEAEPVRVDRDITWVLDDWRLTKTAEISNDFDNRHDRMHNGRVGNTVTINGKIPDIFTVRKGERIRLRLINAANARIFDLDFSKHKPVVIAQDGQPVTPHTPEGGSIILGPAMRIDVIIDMSEIPGKRFTVVDRFYKDLEYRLIDLAYSDVPLRENVPDWPMQLPPNPLEEPNISTAERHEVIFNGGMMGNMVMQEMGGNMGQGTSGGMMNMMHSGNIWFINGKAATGHVMDPVLTFKQGRSYIIAMTNATAWHHPIHLHGHSFRVISRDGQATIHREWQDTVLMAPREKVEIALVADNPGDWMFHCHILEHMAAGMMGVIRVAKKEG